MTLQEIQELIKILNKSNISELRLERDDVKLTLRTKDYNDGRNVPVQAAPQPAPLLLAQTSVMPPPVAPPSTPGTVASTQPQTKEQVSAESEKDLITIKSPMIGTFYRSSGPDIDPFVSVGDEIKVGQVICIVEAMKLFNEIESEVSGKIVKVLIDNATPVEYDQPMFLIDPKA